MKKVVGDILKNRNIDASLQAYSKGFMEINYKYAMIRLAMNYFTYYTMFGEDNIVLQSEYTSIMNAVNEAIGQMLREKDVAEVIEKVETARNKIIENVQDLTCYVDSFNLYEYALNRVEYSFREEDIPTNYSDENITRKLMQFILEDEDRVAINGKISQIIGQLPIRLTKNKFFDMVSDGLSIYNGSTREGLNDFLYRIRTVSMLEKTDTMTENYPYLEELLQEFKQIDFRNITKEQFDNYQNDVARVSEYMSEHMDSNMMLQEIINDLLLVLYTLECKVDDNIIKACVEIITDTNYLFTGKISPKSIEEIEDMFIMLEGCQEELYPQLSAYDITNQIRESYEAKVEELGLSGIFERIYRLPSLNSDSIFAMLDQKHDVSVVSEEDLNSAKEELFTQYSELFASVQNNIKRAVMSATLAELPIFFNNISELQDYIFDTLSLCKQKAEKMACIEILNAILED